MTRLALLIGNDRYVHLRPLQSAKRDIGAVAETLRSVGFDVTCVLDANYRDTHRALTDFSVKLRQGDAGIFWFAGHGGHVDNNNFLLPVDFEVYSPAYLDREAFRLDRVLTMLGHAGVSPLLAVIDACREDISPQFKQYGRGVGSAPEHANSPGGGPPKGFIVVYSSGVGEQALDKLGPDDDSPYSLFTREMLPFLGKEGITISDAVKSARGAVREKAASVGASQTPAIYDQLIEDFYLTPGAEIRHCPIDLPYESLNKLFKGRDKDIERLHSKLSQTDGSPIAVVALHGLGGVGKTRLAVEYALRHRAKYSAAFFVSADKPDQLDANVAKLALAIKSSKGTDQISTATDVVSWLCQNPDWLLILDNVDDEESRASVKQLLNRLSGGHVIITGRLSRFPPQIETLSLRALSSDSALKYLIDWTSNRRVPSIDDNECALEIAQELGCLPLALRIAAAHIRENRSTFADYLALWRKNRQAATSLFFSDDDDDHNSDLVATWATSFSKLEVGGRELLERAAFLSPEPIPEELVKVSVLAEAGEQRGMRALADLERYSLIERDSESKDRRFWYHRLVQDITRRNLCSEGKDIAARRLAEAAEWIQSGLEDQRLAHMRADLIPHAVSALYFLHSDEYRDFAAGDFFERLAQRVIYCLLEVGPKNISPEYLTSIFSDFYEVAPLIGAIAAFRRSDPEAWKNIETQLLGSNNYVLRYAIAANLADNCEEDLAELKELMARFDNAKDLNELECTGYALALVYASRPPDTSRLLRFSEKLAECGTYCGPMIVGHLLGNLVFQCEQEQWDELRSSFRNPGFWHSKWQIIQSSVWNIEAAEAFRAKPRRLPSALALKEVKECYGALITLEGNINEILISLPKDGLVHGLFMDYFLLGTTSQRIREAHEELATSPHLYELMKLLFLHPLWSVVEEAASVLASVVKDNPDYIGIIRRLLTDEDWRVQYGANEAAHYAWESDRKDLFHETMHEFYNHRTAEIRGLCAENLISVILSSGSETRRSLLEEFQLEIRYWLLDEDCWVLEHVYRLFQALHKRNVEFNWLLPSELSPLFGDIPEWYSLDRETFLRHIETRKNGLTRI